MKNNKNKFVRPNLKSGFENATKSSKNPIQPARQSNRQKKMKAKKMWKNLQNEDGYFIFLLGNPRSSKSTILACLTNYFSRKYKVILDNRKGNKSDNNYLRYLVEEIEKLKFPRPTSDYYYEDMSYYSMTVKFPSTPNNDEAKVVFIELAGEDIKKFAYEKDDLINREMEIFFQQKKEKILFFSVLPYPKDDEFTDMHIAFLSRIQDNCHNMSLITSKWDELRKKRIKNKPTPKEFVKQNYPKVHSQFQHMKNCRVFPFSVGQVKEKKDSQKLEISKLVLDDCVDIANWIFEQILIHPKLYPLVEKNNEVQKELRETDASLKILKTEIIKSLDHYPIFEEIRESKSLLEKLKEKLEDIKYEYSNKEKLKQNGG